MRLNQKWRFCSSVQPMPPCTCVETLAISRPISRGDLDLATPAGQARLYWISLLTWVFSESIGVYGLALFLLFGRLLCLFAFLGASAVLLVAYAPRSS